MNELELRVRETGAALRAFQKSASGLTPDAVKASPVYMDAKKAFNAAFSALRISNAKRTP